MGEAPRTTKLLLDGGKREEGGANTSKRAYLAATAEILHRFRVPPLLLLVLCPVYPGVLPTTLKSISKRACAPAAPMSC